MSAKFAKKIGTRPGSIIYVGRDLEHPVRIQRLSFTVDQHREEELTRFTAPEGLLSSGQTVWDQVEGVHDTKLVESLGSLLGIHSLVLEDIVHTGMRPKCEFFPKYAFFVGKSLSRDQETKRLVVGHYCILFGSGWVISFREPGVDIFDSVKQRLLRTTPRVRFMTADYLAYAAIDTVTDGYFQVLEEIGDQIDDLEEEINEGSSSEVLKTIQRLKRQLLKVRKQVWPMREAISGLERSDSTLISSETKPYLHDLYEHIVQVMDTVDMYREQVGNLLELYHTGVSNRMNEIMKVLTVFAAIFIPLSFLAGVYGMNFNTEAGPLNMPELAFRYGYISFWVVAVTVGVGLLWYFRRKDWI